MLEQWSSRIGEAVASMDKRSTTSTIGESQFLNDLYQKLKNKT
ncbi:hypothetical protein RV10_GL004309 [Enterococcus pallens]|nr:hypothetical protein RV10_GL004309 [Enterococcus pallens]